MIHSPNFDFAAFFELKAGIDAIARNKKTPHYKYADLGAIREAIAEDLGKRWVVQDWVEGLRVVTRIYDLQARDGSLGKPEWIESSITMVADLDGQDTGKLITYFRRYNLTVLLALQTEDNDAAGLRPATTATSKRTARTARTSRRSARSSDSE
jgi:hypothetical protein